MTQLREALAPGSTTDANPPDPPTQTAADLPNAQLQDAIEEGSSIVDSMIGARYTTPVAVIEDTDPAAYPHPVDFWARNIAAYLATCTYRGSSDFTDNDPIYRRFITTMDALNNVKNGTGSLNIPPVDSSTGAAGVGAVVNPYTGHLFDACDFDLAPVTYPPGRPRWQDL